MIAWRATWQALAGRGNVERDAILANLRDAREAARETEMGTWKDEIGRIIELHSEGVVIREDAFESVASRIWHQMVAAIDTSRRLEVDIESAGNTYRVIFVPDHFSTCRRLKRAEDRRITGESACLGDGHLSESRENLSFCKHRLRIVGDMLPVGWRIDWDAIKGEHDEHS